MSALPLAGIRAWALMRIARGDSTGDIDRDAQSWAEAVGGTEAQALAEAAIRGDEAFVTAEVPAGLTRENMADLARQA